MDPSGKDKRFQEHALNLATVACNHDDCSVCKTVRESVAECPYCHGLDGTCEASDPKGGYICTREAGHSGDHVACAEAENNPHRCEIVAVWPKDN